jgi:hypothetical protein
MGLEGSSPFMFIYLHRDWKKIATNKIEKEGDNLIEKRMNVILFDREIR